jgi:CheY-like chemotaxis protein
VKPERSGFNSRPIPLKGRGFGVLENLEQAQAKGEPHMELAETLLRKLDDPALSPDERALLCCRAAEDFEHRGQYEAARDALAELWRGTGQRPYVEGLTDLTAAEVLLRAGTLSSWFGSIRQIEGAHEAAKDLISESVALFQALGEPLRAVAARGDLGFCYWREGAFDEARVIYAGALEELGDRDPELRARVSIRLTMVEVSTGRLNDALRILMEITPAVEASRNDALKGKFHNQLALVLRRLGTAECRPDYLDRAVIEYTAAAVHFEEAGHTSYRARSENNLGFLLYTVGRHAEAHQHLDRARRLFVGLKDPGSVAQVDETRARVFLAEGRLKEAERAIRDAVRTLSKGGEQGLLAEALTTQGRVLARLGNFPASENALRRAADLAEAAGAVEDAGRALLALIEEHCDRLPEPEVLEAYERADDLLKATQDGDTIARLRACARRIVAARSSAISPKRRRSIAEFWANFSLTERVHAFEARYIKRALRDAQGSITQAARLLGFPHHASLSSLLKRRHKNLAHLRTPPEKRRRSVLRLRGPRKPPECRADGAARPVAILYVEDNKLVAGAVRETLEFEGWRVELRLEGAAALKEMEGTTHYDLFMFDYELPGMRGTELIRLARQLPHRRRTPIIMFSASHVEAEARAAGADVFLKKPEDLRVLAETVSRLLKAAAR